MRALLAAVAALGLAASAQGALIFSFEGSLEGFVDDGASTAILANSTTGATDGTQSMSIQYHGFAQIKTNLTLAQWTTIQQDPKLTLDYTIPAGSGWGGWWGQLTICVNSQLGGWQSGPTFAFPNVTPGTHTATFDLSALTILPNPGTWEQLFIQHNWGTTTPDSTLYIDNIQTVPVPEPTIAAGIAISSLGLMIRRRQK